MALNAPLWCTDRLAEIHQIESINRQGHTLAAWAGKKKTKTELHSDGVRISGCARGCVCVSLAFKGSFNRNKVGQLKQNVSQSARRLWVNGNGIKKKKKTRTGGSAALAISGRPTHAGAERDEWNMGKAMIYWSSRTHYLPLMITTHLRYTGVTFEHDGTTDE